MTWKGWCNCLGGERKKLDIVIPDLIELDLTQVYKSTKMIDEVIPRLVVSFRRMRSCRGSDVSGETNRLIKGNIKG